MPLNEKNENQCDENIKIDIGCENSMENKSHVTKKEDYQIAICQDGKFAATFDTANFRIKILENTDHRSSANGKSDKSDGNDKSDDKSDRTDEINKTIAYFKINDDFTIYKSYKPDFVPPPFNEPKPGNDISTIVNNNGSSSTRTPENNESKRDDKFRFSFDVSNMYRKQDKDFIFVAVSHIDVSKNVKSKKGKKDEDNGNIKFTKIKIDDKTRVKADEKQNITMKGTAIYCIKLKNDANEDHVLDSYYYCDSAGMCKFVQESNNGDGSILKKFILMNFCGIYSFEYNNSCNLNGIKFNYPTSFRCELDSEISDYMNLLLSCIYDKYFLFEHYNNSLQIFEVYDLVEMKLSTLMKRVEKDKLTKRYNKNVFSIGKRKSQLCFSRGLRTIRMFLIENGLEAMSKKVEKIDKIYLLEFIENDEKLLIIGTKGDEKKSDDKKNLKLIIWDMHNTGEAEEIETALDESLNIKNIGAYLARTSGNILQVDDKGKVTSILKKFDNELKQKKKAEKELKPVKFTEPNGDKCHILHSTNFEPIVDEKEPWVLCDYERNSFCLYRTETETLQLIVGRSTVQIWHRIYDETKERDNIPNRGEPFIEYIWTNGIPVNQEREETRLRIDEFKYGSNDNRLNDFYLKVHWYERVSKKIEDNERNIKKEDSEIKEMVKTKKKKVEIMQKKEKIIQWQDINNKINAVKHACKALEFLNKRTSYLVNNFKKHRYEEMVAYIYHIIWRFIKYKPNDYRLLDVQHNVMKNLIFGDCDHLIKFILFGNEDKPDQFIPKHIPRKIYVKDDKKSNERDEITSVMELAIDRCKGRKFKETIIVAYLLEYYSSRATDFPGWMSTVSKALPLLFKYNYDDYAKKLFRKECFANQGYLSALDPYDLIPQHYNAKRNLNTKFRAFKPTYNLQPDVINNLDNNLAKSPLTLRLVPLLKFTINNIPKQEVKYNLLINIFLFLFIPRWYRIGRNQKNLLSPFSKVVRYENNDDMYDNPAIEAVIDFHWKQARNYFLSLFLRYLIFAFCFILVSWMYLGHKDISEKFRNFLVALIVIFYYLAIYLIITEIIQLNYHGLKEYYGDIFNIFDVTSIVFPVIIMSIMLKKFQFYNGFGSTEAADTGLIAGISFSIFIIWIEIISYFRLIPSVSFYIHYSIVILKTVYPFVLFMLIVIIAFGHTMFVLLRDPENIATKDSTFSGAITNTLTNEKFIIEMKDDFDPMSRTDNPFSFFSTAIVAAYFWLSGNWTQNKFDFWAVDVLTLIASLFLVTILQNIVIAFIGGVHKEAMKKGRQSLLRFKAKQIANYEASYHTYNLESDPRYIYYFGQPKNIEAWYKSRKNNCPIYKELEENFTIKKYTFEEYDYDKFSIWKY